MDSPVSVAATELDSVDGESGDAVGNFGESGDAAGNAAGDAAGDNDDMYGFLARSVEEHDMLRARSRNRRRAPHHMLRARSRSREQAPSTTTTTTAAATSSNRELRFRRQLDAVYRSNWSTSGVPTDNPMILQMRAFVHTELPDYSRLTTLRERWPSYPWGSY